MIGFFELKRDQSVLARAFQQTPMNVDVIERMIGGDGKWSGERAVMIYATTDGPLEVRMGQFVVDQSALENEPHWGVYDPDEFLEIFQEQGSATADQLLDDVTGVSVLSEEDITRDEGSSPKLQQ